MKQENRKFLGNIAISWYVPVPCPHHNMKKVSDVMSKCSKCGIVDYYDTYIDKY